MILLLFFDDVVAVAVAFAVVAVAVPFAVVAVAVAVVTVFVHEDVTFVGVSDGGDIVIFLIIDEIAIFNDDIVDVIGVDHN